MVSDAECSLSSPLQFKIERYSSERSWFNLHLSVESLSLSPDQLQTQQNLLDRGTPGFAESAREDDKRKIETGVGISKEQ